MCCQPQPSERATPHMASCNTSAAWSAEQVTSSTRRLNNHLAAPMLRGHRCWPGQPVLPFGLEHPVAFITSSTLADACCWQAEGFATEGAARTLQLDMTDPVEEHRPPDLVRLLKPCTLSTGSPGSKAPQRPIYDACPDHHEVTSFMRHISGPHMFGGCIFVTWLVNRPGNRFSMPTSCSTATTLKMKLLQETGPVSILGRADDQRTRSAATFVCTVRFWGHAGSSSPFTCSQLTPKSLCICPITGALSPQLSSNPVYSSMSACSKLTSHLVVQVVCPSTAALSPICCRPRLNNTHV